MAPPTHVSERQGTTAGADGDRATVEEIFHLLVELVDRLRGHFERKSAAVGLSPVLAKALGHLDEPINMRDLAARLKVDASYTTSIVDGLEAQGLVDRVVDPNDRRAKNLVLTPKGRQIANELHDELFDDVPAISMLPPQQRDAFRDLLVEMLSH